MTSAPTDTRRRTPGGVGESASRPDGVPKVRGEFAFSSDLWADGAAWGATVRSPHAHARIVEVSTAAALALPGVLAVLTHEDVTGVNRFGLEHRDQPVLAQDRVRYQGEPVALVAADHPETARRAAELVEVGYAVLPPVTDARAAVRGECEPLHEGGNTVRHVRLRHGDPEATAEVVVTGEYEVGMQDQAFLGPESGLAVPAPDGGVDLYVATQWLHVDRGQVAAALGLDEELVRITLAGVGGAFGAREDLSIQVHACLLALRIGRPVKMVYSREESFFGHVHRHPAWMRYEHGADRDGRLVYVRAEIVLDGGAYASSTPAVVGNAGTMGAGPYAVPNVSIDCYGAYTNNPPCGAMRGFGAVQAAFAYESQMDRLGEAVGVDPVEIRVRNALTEGDRIATGQVLDSAAPVAELVRRVRDLPLPPPPTADLRALPGGVGNTTHGEGVRRGVGYAVGIKNVGFSEGFDDYSTARVSVEAVGGEPLATVHTAAVEVGQGLVALQQQIVRTELGLARVRVATADTTVGSAGSTSASRQSYVTGGAVQAACREVAGELLARASESAGVAAELLRLEDGRVTGPGDVSIDVADLVADEPVVHTVEWHHRPTSPLDPETGQGDAHVQLAFAAHRAVVDVDVELGLVKVVALDCAQDVGHALNPGAVVGQIHGGSAQGLGLAVMEEIQVVDGLVRNPSFTDYLIPTMLDMPPMRVDVLELADPHAPYGLRGVGEPPTISSTPAVVAAIRAATGLALTRVPVRPEHLTGT
ncbi:xanthine dehydrogenase subunit D [Nocardioides sp.]|uniref:xanthine dehydrogenase subunit D n=1 Tax=Nocardioides sp. TaxID=35761 RepID=UPI0035298883